MKTDKRMKLAADALCLAILVLVFPGSGNAQNQVEVVDLDGEAAEVIDRIGSAIVLKAEGDGIPGTGPGTAPNRPKLNYEWYMVQDSSLGVVFREPSGVKFNTRDYEYDGDIDLKSLVGIHAVEVRVVTFNVWREVSGTGSTTRILLSEDDNNFNLDPRWDGSNLHKHYYSITYISKVRYADGTVVEADIDPVLRTARRISGDITEEQLVPESEGAAVEELKKAD